MYLLSSTVNKRSAKILKLLLTANGFSNHNKRKANLSKIENPEGVSWPTNPSFPLKASVASLKVKLG